MSAWKMPTSLGPDAPRPTLKCRPDRYHSVEISCISMFPTIFQIESETAAGELIVVNIANTLMIDLGSQHLQWEKDMAAKETTNAKQEKQT